MHLSTKILFRKLNVGCETQKVISIDVNRNSCCAVDEQVNLDNVTIIYDPVKGYSLMVNGQYVYNAALRSRGFAGEL